MSMARPIFFYIQSKMVDEIASPLYVYELYVTGVAGKRKLSKHGLGLILSSSFTFDHLQ